MLRKRSFSSNQKNVQNMAPPLVPFRVGQIEEIDVFEIRIGCLKSVAGRRLGVDAHFVQSAKKMRRNYEQGFLQRLPLGIGRYDFLPDAAFQSIERLMRLPFQQQLSLA